MDEVVKLDGGSVIEYPVTHDQIEEMRLAYSSLRCTSPEGYEAVAQALKHLAKTRSKIEATRVELKSDALEYGRKVDGAAKYLTARIVEIEEPLRAMKREIDDAERLRIEAEQRRIERARQEEIEKRRREEEEKLRREKAEIEEKRRAMEEERRLLAEELERARREREELEKQRAILERAAEDSARIEEPPAKPIERSDPALDAERPPPDTDEVVDDQEETFGTDIGYYQLTRHVINIIREKANNFPSDSVHAISLAKIIVFLQKQQSEILGRISG